MRRREDERLTGEVLDRLRSHACEHLHGQPAYERFLVRLRLAEDPRYRNIIDLVDEVLRLRGVILSSARTVEGSPDRGIENLSRYFDVLMAEARLIREEIR